MLTLLVALNIAGGLALEAYGARQGWLWTEPLVGLLTFCHFGYYLYRPPRIGSVTVTRPMLLTCLLLATAGELILSSVCGFYTYRVSVLPAFVPPGHVLLFLAGLRLASNRNCKDRLATIVPALTFPLLIYNALSGFDYLSLVLFGVFVACVRWGRERKLYAIMFVLALALEVYGTRMQTWKWAPRDPLFGLTAGNPPAAAGVFYALLDLLTVSLVARFGGKQRQNRSITANVRPIARHSARFARDRCAQSQD